MLRQNRDVQIMIYSKYPPFQSVMQVVPRQKGIETFIETLIDHLLILKECCFDVVPTKFGVDPSKCFWSRCFVS